MSYYFVENRYPDQDSNIDLNFDNDILYGSLTDNDLDKHNVAYVMGGVVPNNRKKQDLSKKKKSDPSNSIYLCFIFTIILIMIIWYVYNNKNSSNPNIMDQYPTEPELTMLSPDFGNGVRYGKI